MSIEAVQLYLCQDVLVGLASSAQVANPEWATSEPPWYSYKSLGQMLVLNSCPTGVLSSRIVCKLGEGKEDARGDIILQPTDYESTAYRSIGFNSNTPGAETTVLDLKFSLPNAPGVGSYQRMLNLVLRVRYLLDETWRKKRGAPPYIPNVGDPTVGSLIRCVWQKDESPIRAEESYQKYILCYNRIVPRN